MTTIRARAISLVCAALAGVASIALAQESPATITMAIQAAGNSSEALQGAVDAFNEAHGDILVEANFYGTQDAYNQALQAQIAAGVAPDVFWVDAPLVDDYVDFDAVRPLDDLISGSGFPIDDYIGALTEAFTVDGRLYAIPKDYNVSVLVYNEDLLAGAGVAVPTTWSELATASAELTSDGQWGFGMYPQLNYFYPFAASNGADFVTEGGIGEVVSDAHVASIEMLVSLFEDGVAVTPQMIGASWDGDMFAKGQAAMVYGGSWLPASVASAGFGVGVAPVPTPSAGAESTSWSYTAGWGISTASEHPEAAMTFIEFLGSPDMLVHGFENGFNGLPPTGAGTEALAAASPDLQESLAVYREVASHSVSFGWAPSEFVTAYNEMLQALVSNPDRDVAAELADLAEDVAQD